MSIRWNKRQIDPVLEAHRVGKRMLDISSNLSPASIRDQQIRAQLVVQRAWERKLIGRDKQLLVVGAGAGGVTAALHAANLGVKTVLVEQAASPFLRQLHSTRWIDPTQYDWPLAWWDTGKSSPASPLPWVANRAWVFGTVWAEYLNQHRIQYRSSNRLRVYYSIRYEKGFFSPSSRAAAKLAKDLNLKSFSMVVLAAGSGTERCRMGDFHGPPFWDPDPLEDPDLGLAKALPEAGAHTGNRLRILISGGGDGALQDFIRVVTRKKSAREVLSKLPFRANERMSLERLIYSEEDLAQRAYAWNCSKEHDHAILQHLHDQTRREARRWSQHRRLRRALEELVQPVAAIEVTLSHACTHFPMAYPLNRFLGLLLAQFLESKRRKIIRSNCRVSEVRGVDHDCENDWVKCYGRKHRVQWQASGCSSHPPPIASVAEELRRRDFAPWRRDFGRTPTAPASSI